MKTEEIEKIIGDVIAVLPDIWNIYLDIKNGKSLDADIADLLQKIASDLVTIKSIKNK